MEKLVRYADAIAIPFWIIFLVYMLMLDNKKNIHYLLTVFAMCGLAIDTIFTIDFLFG